MQNKKLQARIEVLRNKEIRYKHHDSFMNPHLRVNIMAVMPNHDIYIARRQAVYEEREQIKPDSALRPCYEEPLLTTAQEKHLFLKMNYLKYRSKQLVDKFDETTTAKQVTQAEDWLAQSVKIRNLLASANFRLSTMHLRSRHVNLDKDYMLSEAYTHILRAIEGFDVSLGNKFSTYATWVIKRNTSRDMAKFNDERLCYCDEFSPAATPVSSDSGYQEELRQTNILIAVSKL